MNILNSTSAQSGFLSIDCGSTRAQYNDSLGLEWVTDNGTYMTTGLSYEQSYVNYTFLNSSAGAGMQALQSFRSFPDRRSKYCYELETEPKSTYLIRASFYMNVYELSMRAPFQFVAHLNGTQWFTLMNNGTKGNDLFVTQEAIFNSPAQVMYFCLQPVVGMPFISSLELRRLASTMYTYSGSNLQYLSLLYRYNMGNASSTPQVVRFPDDSYDRIWERVHWQDDLCTYNNSIFCPSSISMPQDTTTRVDANYVPPKVMKDAYLFQSNIGGGLFLYFYSLYTPQVYLSPYTPQVYLSPFELAYAILYAENLNSSDIQDPYSYNILLDIDSALDPTYGIVNVSNQASMLVIPNHIMTHASYMDFFIEVGTENALLNAAEAYAQHSFNTSITDWEDENFIKILKNNLSLTDWHGDPCTPVPYDWLTCFCTSCDQEDYPGSVPDQQSTSVYQYSIISMSITYSRVDNPIFEGILSAVYPPSYLDLSYNTIDSIPSAGIRNFVRETIISMKLSHNQITTLETFENESSVWYSLSNLDLSYNAITSLPTMWASGNNQLTVLDLSHNQLEGEISNLDILVQTNSQTLQELYISDNKLSGTFSGSLYFANLPQLSIA
ncbi:unnamed protein product [Calypogeia fissa]